MAILMELLCTGVSRFLNKVYFSDIELSGDLTAPNGLTLSKLTLTDTTLPLTIGTASGQHLEFKNDSILSKNGTSNGTLNLNTNGRINLSNTNNYVNGNNVYLNTVDISNTLKVTGTSTLTTVLASTIGSTTTPVSNAYINTIGSTNNRVSKIYASDGDFKGRLKAVEYDLDSIANLGSTFGVYPTLVFTPNNSQKIVVSGNNSIAVIGTNFVTNVGNIKNGNNYYTWSNGDYVKISGTINGKNIGTITARLNENMTSSRLSIGGISFDSTSKPDNGEYVSDYKLNVCLWKTNSGSMIGIEMSAYDSENDTAINMYNGTLGLNPVLRLGSLKGLGEIKDSNNNTLFSPTGWGLYADNVYLKGSIVAQGGKIGGYTIGSTDLTKGSIRDNDESFWLTPNGSSSTMSALKNSALYWAMTIGKKFGVTTSGDIYSNSLISTGGTIGGWNITDNSICSENILEIYDVAGTGSNPIVEITTKGQLSLNSEYWGGLSLEALKIELTETETYADNTKTTKVIDTPFYISYSGKLYTSDIEAVGGNIGGENGFNIGSEKLYSGNHSSYNSANEGVFIGTEYISLGNGGVSWLKKDGTYQLGGNNGIKYNGSKVTFGTSVEVPSANITGTLSADRIGANSISTNKLAANSIKSNNFNGTINTTTGAVSGNWTTGAYFDLIGGKLYSSDVHLKGEVTATSGTIGDCVIVNGKLQIGNSLNLYVSRDSVSGYINNTGDSISTADSTRKERTSDYIPVKPTEKYTIQSWGNPGTSSLWIGYCFYKEDKSVVGSRTAVTGTNGNKYLTTSITVPTNAAYMRVSARMYSDGLLKIESGSVATPWNNSIEDAFTSGTTTIDGGKITTGTITTNSLATDSLKSKNFNVAIANNGYVDLDIWRASGMGTYFDLENGNLYSGNVHLKGEIEATSGSFGNLEIMPDYILLDAMDEYKKQIKISNEGYLNISQYKVSLDWSPEDEEIYYDTEYSTTYDSNGITFDYMSYDGLYTSYMKKNGLSIELCSNYDNVISKLTLNPSSFLLDVNDPYNDIYSNFNINSNGFALFYNDTARTISAGIEFKDNINFKVCNDSTENVMQSYIPYYKKGDIISGTINTAGYVTASSAEVRFTIPLSKPVIGIDVNEALTANNLGYITIRQTGYTHGTNANNNVRPKSVNATFAGNYINVNLTMNATTSATNNAPCGVRYEYSFTL